MPADDKTVNDIFEKLGDMSGTMARFIETQDKYNDRLFETQRKHDGAISSLLQTRRTQWKVITLIAGSWSVILILLHRILPFIPPPNGSGP